MTRIYDAVIIGSGFGGSINARRLAEAGRSVLVLERGRRYAPKDFPRDIRDVDAILWRHPEHREGLGLYDLRMLSGVISVSAAGVGGGSLIYASIHYRPQARIFNDPRWPDPFNLDSLEPYYARVAEALGVQTVPKRLKLAKRDAFHDAAAKLGYPCFDTPQAVSWDTVHGANPGGVRAPCKLCAECEFGCPHGSKNTLDFTYLAEAEARGAQVEPHRSVTHISPARVDPDMSEDQPGWTVHYADTRTGEPGAVTGRRVIVAAGTLGTGEILLRSRDQAKTLPKLSHRLGWGYSANGDFLGNIQNADRSLEPWIGPDVTSVMLDFDNEPGFSMATPTFNKPVMEFLASMGQREPAGPLMRRLAGPSYDKVDDLLPWVMKRGLIGEPMGSAPNAGPADRFVTVFSIGEDNAGGRLVLRDGALDLLWDYEAQNRELVARQEAAMRALARAYGGTYGNLPTWDLYRRIMTVHNLGGCALSTSADTGVVGIDGQIHGHPGLYVSDGSVIPTAIGSHPVMTISAVSEWIAEHVVASFA